jgi:hypothetical protein
MSTHLAAAIIAKIGSFDLGDCAPDEDPEEARLQHIEREVFRIIDNGDVFADYANASPALTAAALLYLCADLSEDARFGLIVAITEALENARDDSAEDEDLPSLLADLES